MINGKKVLAITLARGGSLGIPKKNIVPVNGRPLICYTLDEVKKSEYIDDYYVSTDNDEIAEVVLKNNVKVINRPSELAKSSTTSSEALLHAVKEVDNDYFYIVEAMATNPLKTVRDIDGCIYKIEEKGYDSVLSVVPLFDHHPARVKYIENDKLMDFYPEVIESRRQDLWPFAYVRNGSVYCMKKEFLLKSKSRYDKNTSPYIMSKERSINIDEIEDLYLAEIILKNRGVK